MFAWLFFFFFFDVIFYFSEVQYIRVGSAAEFWKTAKKYGLTYAFVFCFFFNLFKENKYILPIQDGNGFI